MLPFSAALYILNFCIIITGVWYYNWQYGTAETVRSILTVVVVSKISTIERPKFNISPNVILN